MIATKEDRLSILKEGQRALATHYGSPIRAGSGAGTGKTFALTERIHHLVENVSIPPRQILCMTFTRKAAEEMKTRIKAAVGIEAEHITVGNFHHVAIKEVLSGFGPEDRPHILDDIDSKELWEEAFFENPLPLPNGLSKDDVGDIRGKRTGRPADAQWESVLKNLLAALYEIESSRINQNIPEDQFLSYAQEKLEKIHPPYEKLKSRCPIDKWMELGHQSYKRLKTETRSFDYDGLLLEWALKLETDEAYRKQCQSKWTHILIDEYQDTNFLQERIIRNLNCDNLVVIGDVAQCLYSWRNAVPDLMMTMQERYPDIVDVTLDENFRSKDEILDLANEVLEQHDRMLSASKSFSMPPIRLKGVKGDGGSVLIKDFEDPQKELSYIQNRINYLRNQGADLCDIVVLARTSFYLQPLEMSLKTQRVPVQIWGGRSLSDSRTAKDFLALLKATLRPGQPASFKKIATMLPGIGPKAADRLYMQHVLGTDAPPEAAKFLKTLNSLAMLRQMEKDMPEDGISLSMTKVAMGFLEELYKDEKGEIPWQKQNEIKGLQIVIEEVLERIQQDKRDLGNEDPMTLDDLVSYFSLDSEVDKDEGGKLTLSTIHQAKGLEWKHVIIAGCHEGKLPIKRKEELTQTELEEECRALYVAVTRAEETLAITYAGEISRFLAHRQ